MSMSMFLSFHWRTTQTTWSSLSLLLVLTIICLSCSVCDSASSSSSLLPEQCEDEVNANANTNVNINVDTNADADATSKEEQERIEALKKEDPWFVSEEVNSYSGDHDVYWEYFDCEELLFEEVNTTITHANNGTTSNVTSYVPLPRPIHNATVWSMLRGLYLGLVGPNFQKLEDIDQNIYTQSFPPNLLSVEYTSDKGRTIFAATDIPKGTLIWNGYHTARFPSPTHYRRFLLSLPEDALACDVMIWSYVEDYDWEGMDTSVSTNTTASATSNATTTTTNKKTPTISCDLDEGTFFNSAPKGQENIASPDLYTLRDIVKGEELLVHYQDFERPLSWTEAGFGSQNEHTWWENNH